MDFQTSIPPIIPMVETAVFIKIVDAVMPFENRLDGMLDSVKNVAIAIAINTSPMIAAQLLGTPFINYHSFLQSINKFVTSFTL